MCEDYLYLIELKFKRKGSQINKVHWPATLDKDKTVGGVFVYNQGILHSAKVRPALFCPICITQSLKSYISGVIIHSYLIVWGLFLFNRIKV